ncbi:hypothetical protein BD779DRAFT_530703 [Infundibulicybe gibba]|nr:hypothetical protein BD779DRAFT_530703 [Infundibulicybe gibba]
MQKRAAPPFARISTMNVYLLGLLSLVGCGLTHAEGQIHFSGPSTGDWEALKKQLPGRLFQGSPFAQPCFSQTFNSTSCDRVRLGYLDELTRSNNSGAYIQPQWETCQRSGEQCLLDSSNPNSTIPSSSPFQCQSGSIPDYFIDVHEAKDVSLAFAFSKKTGVPLIVKNTGHDYKGRSSAPHSLALWVCPIFIPESSFILR